MVTTDNGECEQTLKDVLVQRLFSTDKRYFRVHRGISLNISRWNIQNATAHATAAIQSDENSSLSPLGKECHGRNVYICLPNSVAKERISHY